MKMALAFRHDVGWNFRFIIARVTGSPVHVALLFGDDVCIEADGGRVRQISRADRLRVGEWTIVPCDITDAQVQRAFAFAQAQIGKPYDWLGVLWAWWWGGHAGMDYGKFFCSKLGAAALMAADVDMQPARAAAYFPRRLYDWCAPWR